MRHRSISWNSSLYSSTPAARMERSHGHRGPRLAPQLGHFQIDRVPDKSSVSSNSPSYRSTDRPPSTITRLYYSFAKVSVFSSDSLCDSQLPEDTSMLVTVNFPGFSHPLRFLLSPNRCKRYVTSDRRATSRNVKVPRFRRFEIPGWRSRTQPRQVATPPRKSLTFSSTAWIVEESLKTSGKSARELQLNARRPGNGLHGNRAPRGDWE